MPEKVLPNEWIARALNILNDTKCYQASRFGIYVGMVGGGYTIDNDYAISVITRRIEELGSALPAIRKNLQDHNKRAVDNAHKALIRVGGE